MFACMYVLCACVLSPRTCTGLKLRHARASGVSEHRWTNQCRVPQKGACTYNVVYCQNHRGVWEVSREKLVPVRLRRWDP